MGSIAIKLNPSQLANPDADVRYRLPDLIQEATAGRIRDNGYDYISEEGNTLIVYLACATPDVDAEIVIQLLRDNPVCENWLLNAAVIGISKDDKIFRIVHPPESAGEFTVRPW